MEDASPLVAEPLQNCGDPNNNNNHHTLQSFATTSKVLLERLLSPPKSGGFLSGNEENAPQNAGPVLPGNEENAPENSLDDRSQNHHHQQQIIKKMRMGGTPNKQLSRRFSGDDGMSNKQQLSRRFSGSEPPVKSLSNNRRQSHESIKKAQVERPMLFDPPSVAPPSSFTVLPTLQQAPSCDSGTEASSSFSANSHNWLDDFGKQQLQQQGNFTAPEQQQPRSNATQIHVADKDPRFHCKRKTQQQKAQDRSSTNHHEHLHAALFPADPMEGTQVFLAPIIVPPAEAKARRASWKAKEQMQGFSSPTMKQGFPSPVAKQGFSSPAMKRSSVFESSHAAIAAAQEAPDLAESLSQETASTTSNNSSNLSGLTSSTTSSMASALVKRIVDKSSATKDTTKARLQRHSALRSTPIRIKPRVKPQEVQATDQGYASVAKLSAWLADDPTSTKKVRHVRRGANVISKSRKFEKDLEDVIVEENKIMTGAVKEKKDWLKSAFSDTGAEEHPEEYFHHHDPNRHMMMMRTQPVNDDDCARSEFVVSNDTASCTSVSDKKKWLQNAFKKEDGNEASGSQRHLSYKARSDIGPVRESRDDVTSRAKSMWKQKSEKRMPDAPASAHKPPRAAPSPYRSSNQRPPAMRDTPPKKSLEERMRSALGPRGSAPSPVLTEAAKAASSCQSMSSRHTVIGVPLEEDNTPVDFRAARQLLIQRSKDNGNDVNVASKVQRRADKFEKLSKDTKRRSSAMGLLKPTWESNTDEGSPERPSDSYTKNYIEDIAPKRSIDELP